MPKRSRHEAAKCGEVHVYFLPLAVQSGAFPHNVVKILPVMPAQVTSHITDFTDVIKLLRCNHGTHSHFVDDIFLFGISLSHTMI